MDIMLAIDTLNGTMFKVRRDCVIGLEMSQLLELVNRERTYS